MAQLASNRYLGVHSQPKEDHYNINDPSSGQVYEIFVPQSRLSVGQPLSADTIVHRSRTGKHKHIERLRCTVWERAFSEQVGTSSEDVSRTKATSLPKAA